MRDVSKLQPCDQTADTLTNETNETQVPREQTPKARPTSPGRPALLSGSPPVSLANQKSPADRTARLSIPESLLSLAAGSLVSKRPKVVPYACDLDWPNPL